MHNQVTSSPVASSTDVVREHLPRPTDRLQLGDFSVSPYCLGGVDDPETVLAAREAGINFFFVTTDMHWPLYEALRRGLAKLFERKGARDEVVVAAVSYVTQPEFCTMPFIELLSCVPGLERIDVLVAGGAYGHEIGTRLRVYEINRQRAHCGARAIGASFHDRKDAAARTCDGSIDVAFIRYNAGHVGAREDVFPHVGNRRALLFNFTNTGGYVPPERCDQVGLHPDAWRPTISDHYRFVLSRPELDGILCAPKTPAQLAALLEAIDDGPLDLEEQAHMELLSRVDRGVSELVSPVEPTP